MKGLAALAPLLMFVAARSGDARLPAAASPEAATGTPRAVTASSPTQPVEKPTAETTAPSGPVRKGGDEVPLGAMPVTSCPLTPAGCAAAAALLATVEAGDYEAIQPRVPIGYPIGEKPGYDLVDAASLTRALDQARQELDSIAVGCPQGNALGPEAGACDDRFVLALPVRST